MLRLSKKMLYAIEAVLDIAYNAGSEPVQSRDITARQGIPKRYLEQALQLLVRENILIGVRGPRGGYRLARERRRISVGDIVRVVRTMEAKDALSDDITGSDLGHKIVRPLWQELHQELLRRLDTISIDDLCSRANQAGIDSAGRLKLDYSI
ncbi:MAG: RrF2 family transcriptional regulator [Rhodospirillales bacterium]|jgi:Rrf2 family protein